MDDGLSRDEEERSLSLLRLSTLMDGELDAPEAHAACELWRVDVQMRSSWHAYHLIGDVLRTDELASDAARDARFLGALRERLAAEPVVLAPQVEAPFARPDAAQRGARRWAWLAPTAVAAGFMAVAIALLVTRDAAGPGRPADTLAQSLGPPAPGRLASSGATALVAEHQVVRDPRLERYLAAHKQFGGSSALGVPSGFLRAATIQSNDR